MPWKNQSKRDETKEEDVILENGEKNHVPLKYIVMKSFFNHGPESLPYSKKIGQIKRKMELVISFTRRHTSHIFGIKFSLFNVCFVPAVWDAAF